MGPGDLGEVVADLRPRLVGGHGGRRGGRRGHDEEADGERADHHEDAAQQEAPVQRVDSQSLGIKGFMLLLLLLLWRLLLLLLLSVHQPLFASGHAEIRTFLTSVLQFSSVYRVSVTV